MNQQTLVGQLVTLTSARGEIDRVVLAEQGDILVVVTADEYEQAKITGITPFSIGFLRSDVLRHRPFDNSVSLKHNVQYEQAEHSEAGANRGTDG